MSKFDIFEEKYRVGSAAFWNSNNEYNLENSDRIVLPQSALKKLNPLSFPVTLKITNANQINKYRYCNVIDFNAPEGLVYMSTKLIKQLSLDSDKQSLNDNTTIIVRKLNPNDGGTQYCRAEFIQFQPMQNEFVFFEDASDVVKQTLLQYYSSLKLGDIIHVKYKNLKTYELKVSNLLGKNKTVSEFNILSNNIFIGFIDPPKFLSNDNDDNMVNMTDEYELDPEFDWEIVSLERIKKEINQPNSGNIIDPNSNNNNESNINNNNNNNDDIKVPNNNDNNNNENNDDNDIPIERNSDTTDDENDNNDDNMNNDDDGNKDGANDANEANEANDANDVNDVNLDDFEWICPKCNTSNELKHKFCPNCGQMQMAMPKPEISDKNEGKIGNNNNNNNDNDNEIKNSENQDNEVNNINGHMLVLDSLINKDTKYHPGESRSTGFILKNISNKSLKTRAKFERIDQCKEVKIEFDNLIDVDIDDALYLVLEIKAPKKIKNYSAFFQLISMNNDKRICDLLQININVVSPFSPDEETKIQTMISMGFNDRNKIIESLQKWKWDMEKAVNWYVTH